MTPSNEDVRAAIAQQAAEWFIANHSGSLTEKEGAEFLTWLRDSPAHVREYLGVARIAHRLPAAVGKPQVPLETFLAQAANAPAPRSIRPIKDIPVRRWQTAAVIMAVFAAVGLGLFSLLELRSTTHVPAPTTLHFETRHGEQQTHHLADNSVLHLNTDTAVTIRYTKTERLVVVSSGEADFEVAHEPGRAFRVFAGAAQLVDLGTQFDVRLEQDSTVVTVVEGQLRVGPSPMLQSSTSSGQGGFVQLSANQQIRVIKGEWPPAAATVDAQRATAWLHRQIMFEHEPLQRVATEINRYAPKPIEIVTPELRDLEISGTFSTDDSQEFIAFLRTLEGVQVEVTATRIRVSQK